jgi:uncharacterized protein
MSAVNTSYDLDAIQRAQRAYEPSMEEILASIRSIISEDRAAPPPKGPSISAVPDEAPTTEAPAAEAPAVNTAVHEPEPSEAIAGPRVVWPKPDAVDETPIVTAPVHVDAAPSAVADEEPLLSAATNAAIASSFDALSVSVAVQNSGMIEGAVRDMIRPMLKAWLDDNLPSLVETLVRAEIQRVARGGR